MSDLFYDRFSDSTIDGVLAVMLLSPHHTFQILTKRAERMQRYLSDRDLYGRVLEQARIIRAKHPRLCSVGISNPSLFPAKWIWWGVSVGIRSTVHRLEQLRATPAAVRFVSFEPLLEDLGSVDLSAIDWAIVGGESGSAARPLDSGVGALSRRAVPRAGHGSVRQAARGATILDASRT